jgi:hypothetical protein
VYVCAAFKSSAERRLELGIVESAHGCVAGALELEFGALALLAKQARSAAW